MNQVRIIIVLLTMFHRNSGASLSPDREKPYTALMPVSDIDKVLKSYVDKSCGGVRLSGMKILDMKPDMMNETEYNLYISFMQ